MPEFYSFSGQQWVLVTGQLGVVHTLGSNGLNPWGVMPECSLYSGKQWVKSLVPGQVGWVGWGILYSLQKEPPVNGVQYHIHIFLYPILLYAYPCPLS